MSRNENSAYWELQHKITFFYFIILQWIPISRTLSFSKFPIIRTKPNLPLPVKHCNFTNDFSNRLIIRICFYQAGSKNRDFTIPLQRFSYDLQKWFGKISVRYLFYQPMDEKIKTWTLRFPAKENPNMENALFDWPIVLQYDVKAKNRLISRKFSSIKFLHPSVRLTNKKPRAFVSVGKTN